MTIPTLADGDALARRTMDLIAEARRDMKEPTRTRYEDFVARSIRYCSADLPTISEILHRTYLDVSDRKQNRSRRDWRARAERMRSDIDEYAEVPTLDILAASYPSILVDFAAASTYSGNGSSLIKRAMDTAYAESADLFRAADIMVSAMALGLARDPFYEEMTRWLYCYLDADPVPGSVAALRSVLHPTNQFTDAVRGTRHQAPWSQWLHDYASLVGTDPEDAAASAVMRNGYTLLDLLYSDDAVVLALGDGWTARAAGVLVAVEPHTTALPSAPEPAPASEPDNSLVRLDLSVLPWEDLQPFSDYLHDVTDDPDLTPEMRSVLRALADAVAAPRTPHTVLLDELDNSGWVGRNDSEKVLATVRHHVAAIPRPEDRTDVASYRRAVLDLLGPAPVPLPANPQASEIRVEGTYIPASAGPIGTAFHATPDGVTIAEES